MRFPGIGEDDEESGFRFPVFSALTRRIFFFNAFALLVMIGGVLWIETSRSSLVDERISGVREQALVIGGALAEYAVESDPRSVNVAVGEQLLRQLIAPTALRARVYNTGGDLVIDTRNLLARNVVTMTLLPPPESSNVFVRFFQRLWATIARGYDVVMGIRPFAQLPAYVESGDNGRGYGEVVAALDGRTESAIRVNEQNSLVLSVASPIRRFDTLYGVVMLTTESGDLDEILKAERRALLEVFLVAFIVLLLSSLYLSGFIANPIHKLAQAADQVRKGRSGRETIPTLAERTDEIGELAGSLAAMTRALYDRIHAIESFAADVAHELKNPLTSIKSAVEMWRRADDQANRERLMNVVLNDIKRIDRLISEISDASRLDAELSRVTAEPIDLARLLDTIVDIYAGMDLPRGIQVVLDLDRETPLVVHGVGERLGQVFRNLIDNAVSFSPDHGKVTVSARVLGDIVRARIEDQGRGIPDDNLETIFSRFYTERPAEHGFGKNSGLGLAIARQIVASHGGRIWAENIRDVAGGPVRGARLAVEIPLAGA